MTDIREITVILSAREAEALERIAPGTDAGFLATGIVVEALLEFADDDAARADHLVRWGAMKSCEAAAVIEEHDHAL